MSESKEPLEVKSMLLGENPNSDPKAIEWNRRLLNCLGMAQTMIAEWQEIKPLLTDKRISEITAERAVAMKNMRDGIDSKQSDVIQGLQTAISSIEAMPDVLTDDDVKKYDGMFSDLLNAVAMFRDEVKPR